MAANYEQFKQAWNQMWNAERRQYTEQYKNDSNFQQFAQQYSNEKNTWVVNNTTWTNNGSNSNNQNGTNWHYDPIYYRNEENNPDSSNNSSNSSSDSSNGERKYYENNGYSSDWKNGNGWFYGKTTFDKEETLDKSMFNEAPWKITIEAGTGKETGRPDYEVWDAARETEMKKNLDEYYATMPHLFRDRDTFNKFFEYNKRESDAQRELLDSYWKKAQNDKAANTYTNSDQLKLWFSNGDVTPDILDAIKYNNPDLYAQWEKAMQDDLNARIANYAVPRTATQTADIWMDLVKRLGIEAWDPYQIYDNWVWRCEELGVFNMNNQLSQYISEMESVKNERTRAMQRTMSQWAGRKSQALIDAEVSKTSSLYDARFADLQNMYQATYNQRQQNLAIANQSAQMLQAQAQEDQRIFNNKITGLWFAMKVDDYRTPEQQLQNQLRFNAINNDLQLLNKAKSNDLELYNKYATAKLENQLNYEMQDLTVTDPKQLRANLSNVLDQWYEQYWDIIQRPKSQVIEDVIAYAKANNMSVWEALRKNFIEPLMSKQEYKNSIRDKYWMNTTNEYIKIWDSWAILSKNPDGSFSVSYLWWWTWVGWVWGTVWNDWVYKFSDAEVRDIWWDGKYTDTIWNDINSIWHILQSNDWLRVWTYTSKNWYTYNVYPDRETWIQATVNLLKKWYYWKTLADAAQKWIWQWKDISNAKSVIQQFWLSLDAKLDDSNVRKFIEAMWTWEWTLKWQSLDEWAKWGKDLSWYATVAETKWVTSDPYAWVSWYTNNWTEINSGWWITSLESTYAQDKWRSDWDRDAVLNWYWITIKDFNEQRKKYAEHMMATELQSTLQDSLDRINALIEWEDKENSWIWDYHQWWLDRMSVDTEGEKSWVDSLINPLWTYTDATKWKALFDYLKNNETLNKFLNLKQNWATFWAMQQAEWDMIASSVSELKWEQPKEVFQDNLKKVKERLENQMLELDPTYTADWWISKDYLEKHWIKFEYQPWPWSVNIDLTWMIDYVAW